LENQLKESVELAQKTQKKAEDDKAALETQYHEKIANLEAEYQIKLENDAKNSEGTAERIQKEVEVLQLEWKQKQDEKILELEQSYQKQLESIKSEHEKALASAVDEPLAQKVRLIMNKKEAQKI
jgi:hypothetical protein